MAIAYRRNCSDGGFTGRTDVGLYAGVATTAETNAFGDWLGTPVTYGMDYLDILNYNNGWAQIAIPQWGRWRNETPGRKFVFCIPPLPFGSEYEGDFATGLAGEWDTEFAGMASLLVANGMGDCIIRLGWEPNNPTIGSWHACDNPSGYVSMWQHVHGIMEAVSGTNFTWDLNSANGMVGGHTLDAYSDYYPGDAYVDIISQNVYDVKWQDTSVTAAQRWTHLREQYMGLDDHIEFAASHSKPVAFPEWGLYAPGDDYAGGGDNPYFIQQMRDWIDTNDAVYQSYFNYDWGGGVLDDFPNGKAEYKIQFGGTGIGDSTVMTSDSVTNLQFRSITVSDTVTGADSIAKIRTKLFTDTETISQSLSQPVNVVYSELCTLSDSVTTTKSNPSVVKLTSYNINVG